MSYLQKRIALALIGALLFGLGTWWWFDTFEKRWEAQHHISDAARENPMLAATRLLQQHGYTVEAVTTLDQILRKPMAKGVVILASNHGVILHDQVDRLLSWVGQGNLLIGRPALTFTDKDDDQENEKNAAKGAPAKPPKPAVPNAEFDPFGKRYGVTLRCGCNRHRTPRAEPNHVGTVYIPDVPYALELDDDYDYLEATRPDAEPEFASGAGELLRVYAERNGHVALLAKNFFGNNDLGRHDHAELLLKLIQWQHRGDRSANHAYIVSELDAQKWYEILWARFPLGLLALACALAMLFWASVRRFGPLLPEPSTERRSLIEHIDASGRWLWKAPRGRELLLHAVRASTEKVLLRRAPDLQRLSPAEKIKRVALHCKLPEADLASALQGPPSKLPIDFTRQIRLLRQVRKCYER
jgi:hypothetical protein